MIDDKTIMKEFSNKNGNINTNKTKISWLNKHKDIKEYLDNRFLNDKFISYTFILQRIFNHIEELPKCKNCGKTLYKLFGQWCDSKCQLTDKNFINDREKKIDKHLSYEKTKITKKEKYNDENYNNKEKRKQTCINKYGKEYFINYEKRIKTNLEKYGNENPLSLPEIREKIKLTKLKKYGNQNFVNSDKAKQTIKERYNVENWMASNEFKNKSKETKLKLYGNEYYVNSKKSKQTCLEKYGVDNWGKTKESIIITHTPEVNKKREATKRKNHTFNTSIPETKSYNLLKEKYPDIIRQYKSDVYPFVCDFFIPSLNLYIECNYHWTHGYHPYNKDNKEDQLMVENWKEKNTKFYNNAINTWTIRDINKRKIAKENNLNYIEFWNINELKDWLKIDSK